MTGCLLSRARRQGDRDPAPSTPSVQQLPALPGEPRDQDGALGPHPGVSIRMQRAAPLKKKNNNDLNQVQVPLHVSGVALVFLNPAVLFLSTT